MKIPKILFSRKFWSLVGLIITVILEDMGWISPGAATKLQIAISSYLGAIAISGVGKDAAKVAAK